MRKKNLIIIAVVLGVILLAGLTISAVIQIHQQNQQKEPAPTPFPTIPTQPTEPTQTTEPVQSDPTHPTEPDPTAEQFTLTFVGDCTLGTEYGSMDLSYSFVKRVGENYGYPFEFVLDYFQNDDCTFANLEGVLANDGTPAEKRFRFRGPTTYSQILTQNSIEVVNLANNHTYDYGAAGYRSTKDALNTAGVAFAEQDGYTVVTTESGLTIGLYAINFFLDFDDLQKDIAAMKEQGAEVIVASLHCGDEGVYRPTEKQQSYGKILIDAGVDIVWGHHPHVLQRIEEYNGGIIYYSLGNFSFGGNHNPSDKDSVIVQQQIVRDPDGTVHLGELKLIPCQLSSVTNINDFRPVPYEEGSKEFERAMSKLNGTFTGPDIIPDYKNPNNNDTPKPTDPTQPPQTTEPSEEPTTPSVEPTEPSDEPTDPSVEPTEPSEDPTEPSEDPTEPSEDPTEPSEDPTEPSEDPTEPSEDPTEPSEDPTEPSEDPTEPSEESTEPEESTPDAEA